MTSATHPVPAPVRALRADARRNRERLLEAAEVGFARDGTEASLEDIARAADVGIATLYRHFETRAALLEALIVREQGERVDRGKALLDGADPLAALTEWLIAVQQFSARYRGLAASLAITCADPASPLHATSQATLQITEALLGRAQEHGAVRPEVTPTDLFDLVTGLTIAAEHVGGGPARAEQLLRLALDGIVVTSGV